jgi:hypothetical protein
MRLQHVELPFEGAALEFLVSGHLQRESHIPRQLREQGLRPSTFATGANNLPKRIVGRASTFEVTHRVLYRAPGAATVVQSRQKKASCFLRVLAPQEDTVIAE